MSAPKRKREVQLNFRVSPEELALIEQKMAQLGTKNREAYLRKMALDGYVVPVSYTHLDVYKRQSLRRSRTSKPPTSCTCPRPRWSTTTSWPSPPNTRKKW